MNANPTASRAAYQRTAVLTATQGQLIVMLYDGANKFLAQASMAMRERRFEQAHKRLRRAEMIIGHLLSSLDFEQGGEIAPRLSAIYVFCQRHLNTARANSDPEKIEQVRTLLATLRDAWAHIAAET